MLPKLMRVSTRENTMILLHRVFDARSCGSGTGGYDRKFQP